MLFSTRGMPYVLARAEVRTKFPRKMQGVVLIVKNL
jgi:hypothetical protein